MDDDRRRIGLGRVLSIIGVTWFGLFFLTRSGLFGSNPLTTIILGMGAFFPIALMFAGRVIRRRASRTPVEIEQPAPPAPRPTTRSRPQPPPQTRPPDPGTVEQVSEPVKPAPTSMHEDVESMTSEEMVAGPMPMHEDVESMTSEEMVAGRMPMHEDVESMTSEEMVAGPMPMHEDVESMTSEEMLAEAKKRYTSGS